MTTDRREKTPTARRKCILPCSCVCKLAHSSVRRPTQQLPGGSWKGNAADAVFRCRGRHSREPTSPLLSSQPFILCRSGFTSCLSAGHASQTVQSFVSTFHRVHSLRIGYTIVCSGIHECNECTPYGITYLFHDRRIIACYRAIN